MLHICTASLACCLLIEMYFCKGYGYGEEVDLSKGDWNPKATIFPKKR